MFMDIFLTTNIARTLCKSVSLQEVFHITPKIESDLYSSNRNKALVGGYYFLTNTISNQTKRTVSLEAKHIDLILQSL